MSPHNCGGKGEAIKGKMSNYLYLKRIRKNEVEASVQKYYLSKGYKFLGRGWPDFLFYKLRKESKTFEFVEVKRANQTKLKPAQARMQRLFKLMGLKYKVCFGVNDDGSPNFQEIKDKFLYKKIKKLT